MIHVFKHYAALLLLLLVPTPHAYVWEERRLVKPVYFRRTPTVLHASAGYLAQSNHQSSYSGSRGVSIAGRHGGGAWSNRGLYRIPRDFVVSAKLRAFDPAFIDRIRSQQSGWTVSTPYKPPNSANLALDSHAANGIRDVNGIVPQHVANDKPSYKMFGSVGDHPTQFENEGWDDDENDDDLAHEAQETMPSEPGAKIIQHYIPRENYSASWHQFGLDGYKPYQEEEFKEPMNPVRRSPSPWPERDTSRIGEPRQAACTLPLDRGIGPDDISSWHYSTQEHRCRWFGYRGHGGNANRFYSRAACEAYCIRDLENMCEAVTCSWPGTTCNLMEDRTCKDVEQHHGREWKLKCPPDHPVCLSRRNTRMSPDINYKLIPPECYQPKDSGSCQRKNPSVSYYYDRGRNACMTFYFHNCGGNDNRFNTKSDCMTHCSP